MSFAGQDIRLDAGRSYAIVLTSTDATTAVYPYGDEMNVRFNGNPYPGGALWRSIDHDPWVIMDFLGLAHPGDSDLAFRTYMIVPEPTGGFVLAIAGAAAACLRRRSRSGVSPPLLAGGEFMAAQ